jgi:hypothetical protein
MSLIAKFIDNIFSSMGLGSLFLVQDTNISNTGKDQIAKRNKAHIV